MTAEVLYQREGDTIFQESQLESGNCLRLWAESIRKERTGVHATIGITMNGTVLAWSHFNVERDEGRMRLANSAHSHFSDSDRTYCPNGHLKHSLDIFCRGLWAEQVMSMAGELLEGNPDIGPPKQLAGPYIIDGGGTITYAPPGRGKSYLALAMAVSLDSGCDKVWPVQQRRVLFVNLERSRDSVAHRLARINRALGLPERRPLPFINARGRSLSDIEDGVAEAIKQYVCGVLFVDSISRMGAGDLTEATAANRIVDALNNLCPTWLALGHTPRSDDTHVFGSVHFEAGQDVGVRLLSQTVNDTTGIGLDITKANDLPRPPIGVFALEWSQDGLENIRLARRHEFPEIEAGRPMSLADEIAEYLAMIGRGTGTEVAEAIGRNRANVAMELKRNSRFILIGKEGRQVFYGLREERQI